jgi:hypothetical protein
MKVIINKKKLNSSTEKRDSLEDLRKRFNKDSEREQLRKYEEMTARHRKMGVEI